MGTLWDRLVASLLRAIATVLVFAGAAAFVAAVPTFGLLPDSPVASAVAAILLQIAAVLLVAGIAARYLCHRRRPLFPNEQAAVGAERPSFGGWLSAMALALAVLPVLLVVSRMPFLNEWQIVLRELAASGLWETANSNMSGIVLLPLAAALTPPALELAAMAAFVGTSVLMLPMLLTRGQRLPRLYSVSMLLSCALVFASVRASEGARLVSDAAHRLIDETARPGEADSFRDVVNRYTTAVGATAPVLVWTLVSYLVWLPPLLLSQRARATFAQPVAVADQTPVTATTVKAITTPPRFPVG